MRIRFAELRRCCGLELCLALQLAAFWPVWRWYVARLGDGSDEPWGLLPLLAALYFALRERRRGGAGGPIPLPAVLFGAVYVLTYWHVPPLVRAICAVCSLGSMLSQIFFRRAFEPALFGLLLLSLPVIATMQFYLGYPLRAATAALTALWLRCAGLDAHATGALLSSGTRSVWVDAPCSGIKMMWMASFLTLVLIMHIRPSKRAAAVFGAAASGFVFIANCVRSAFLFFLEINLPEYPTFLHPALGVLCFTSVAFALLLLSRLLRREEISERPSKTTKFPRRVAFLAVVACAGCMPTLKQGIAPREKSPEPSWPSSYEGSPLVETPLSDRERKFAEEFPGEIRRFRAGSRELIVRSVLLASRKLHPSSDCLRAVGFRISGENAEIVDGAPRSCFEAVRGSERLKVCEYIQDSEGGSFPDVSSWYWAALWGKTEGPWMAFTVSERAA